MMTPEQRVLVVETALSYQGTPYHDCARVKGKRGGVDCLTFIVCVYEDAGLIQKPYYLPYYNPRRHMHSSEEKYLEGILSEFREIASDPLPGDLVLYKMGRCFAHAAIVVKWPVQVIHARFLRNVYITDPIIDADLRGRPVKFFTLKGTCE